MSKGIKFGYLAGFALLLGVTSSTLTSCNEDKPMSHAAEGEMVDPSENKMELVKPTTAAVKPEKFDPLNPQKGKEKGTEEVKEKLPVTTASFSEYEWDFGTIDEGDKVEHTFTFTNTGTNPLVLETCKGSCGCTVPTCPKEPIPPGGTGEIGVVFNSKGKKNKQTKRVTITCNTEEQPILKIHAQVTPEDEVEKEG